MSNNTFVNDKKNPDCFGVIALILCLSIYGLGSLSPDPPSSFTVFFTQIFPNDIQIVSDSPDGQFEGLFHRKFESQIVPKVSQQSTFFIGEDFFLTQSPSLCQGENLMDYFNFLCPTDLTVKYCNLRI